MKYKSFALVSSIALAASMASPASAQDAAEGQQADTGRTNEIIVTAEFREARLQDTPIAITAVNAEMLEARGATDVAAIAAQAPNVVLRPQGQASGTGLIAYIRGVGQTDFIYARDPGVGVYIDDVYIPTLQSSLIELMDLERVEVLRGPQGTLAGKNSIGGSIKLFGKKPTGNDSGSLEVSYGSFNDIRVRGFADFGVSDTLAVRISGMSRSTQGYVDLIDYGLTHPTSNVKANQSIGQFPTMGKVGGRNLTAGRIALNYDPVDNLNIYVTADYTSQRGDAGAEVLIAAGRPTGGGFSFNGTGQNPAVSFSPNSTTQVPWLVGKDGQAVTVGCQFVPYGAYSCDTPPAGYDPRYISYANFLDASPVSSQAPFK
ncbi:MAG: TonB-dependent receptor, partial [Sphingomonadales bacterium]